MAGLKKYSYFGIWFLSLSFALTQCKNDSSHSDGEIDYTDHWETISDIDKNSYEAFGIGTQIWMTQNLRTSRLNSGTKINLVTDNNQWKSLSQPGYCWYNNDSIKNERFGTFYNFFTVETGLLCPTGWHVPTRNDWNILIRSLEGENLAGGRMKAYFSGFWNYPANFANRPGFSAMPGGFRSSALNRQFTSIDSAGYWWTLKSESDSGYYSIVLKASSTAVYSSYFLKQDGLSIRCIKD